MFSHGKCRICPVFMRFPKDRIEKIRNPIGDGNRDASFLRNVGDRIEKIRNPIGDGNRLISIFIYVFCCHIEKIRNPIGDGNSRTLIRTECCRDRENKKPHRGRKLTFFMSKESIFVNRENKKPHRGRKHFYKID